MFQKTLFTFVGPFKTYKCSSMKTNFNRLCIWMACLFGCAQASATIPPAVVEATIEKLAAQDEAQQPMIARGVRQVANLWQPADGDVQQFQDFCLANYFVNPEEKEQVFLKISDYLEGINGNFNAMTLRLQRHFSLDTGPLHRVDELFAAFSPSSHLTDDLYAAKIAFIVALNFPQLTLAEKEALGSNRKAWAYARMGDLYTRRIPADVQQHVAGVLSDVELYIANYNIYMGCLRNDRGEALFSADMRLLSHWNLRDEIKADYALGKQGLEKQQMIYRVMEHIIAQDIPAPVVNSDSYLWNPFSNSYSKEGAEQPAQPETAMRYQKLLDCFHAQQRIDAYAHNTYIDRKFNEEMEIAVDDAERLFDSFLSAPELKEIGKLVRKRLGRKLQPFDIWYDGFKSRSTLDENELTKMTRSRYPNAEALDRDLPEILKCLGFSPERAEYIADKISVDAARGSGHAWPATMKGQHSRLRTRIAPEGMDYKGYNIAIHEFGHNVEETISLYDVDYYLLSGVPNTAFTEALAFVFQHRDLQVLGMEKENPDQERMDVLDRAWGLYEICGVSMLDISVWKWMYAHPTCTAEELRDAVVSLSKEIWNRYYAPVYGVKDATLLAIYSHMISYPLYLSAYAFGHIIQFQIEDYLKGRSFADEVSRIYSQGRLTPNVWIRQATGSDLTADALLAAVCLILI